MQHKTQQDIDRAQQTPIKTAMTVPELSNSSFSFKDSLRDIKLAKIMNTTRKPIKLIDCDILADISRAIFIILDLFYGSLANAKSEKFCHD